MDEVKVTDKKKPDTGKTFLTIFGLIGVLIAVACAPAIVIAVYSFLLP